MVNMHDPDRLPAPPVRRCLACGREKPGADFALKSLWPSALGGAAAPNPFQNDSFCATCRALCDLMVDGAFLKSWFMQAELARTAREFIDPARPGPAPLAYLGQAADFPVKPGEICERWTAQSGEAVYFIGPDTESGWAGYGRGDELVAAAPDPGRVILNLTSPSHYWSGSALASVAAHFPLATRCCVTDIAQLKHHADQGGALRPGEIEFFRTRGNRQKILNAGLKVDFSQRFLIKLALGLGQSLFGEAFTATTQARKLRKSFWDQLPRAAAMPGGALVWPGAWALTLDIRDGAFGLFIATPAGRALSVAIAGDEKLWAGPAHEALRHGQCFVAIPQRQIFSGPWPLADCLAHCSGAQPHPDLAALDALRGSAKMLPSRQGFA